METTKILSANFLDILFDGRNKEYGAYQLRRSYGKRMGQALVITAAMLVAAWGWAYFRNTFAANNSPVKIEKPDVVITQITPEKDEPELPKPPEPPKVIDVPQVKTIALVTPKIVKDIEVVDPPPSQDDLKIARISDVTREGVNDFGIVTPPIVVDDRKGIVEIVKIDDDNGGRPFEKVEIDAKYPGGNAAWRTFLERNLRGETPVDNSAAPGTYTVIIQFVVNKQGNLSDIKALTNMGYGMEAEAIRVIKRSGQWIPAVQNGNHVTAYRKQPITFQVLGQ